MPSLLASTFLISATLVTTGAFAADPVSRDAAAKAKAADKILSPAQLRDCLAQQTKLKQEDADADKQNAALDAEKAEIVRTGNDLATLVTTLDKTSADAVNSYNEQVQARVKRIDAYEASVDQYNARVATIKTERDAYTKSCNNRRFLEDDETAIKKGK